MRSELSVPTPSMIRRAAPDMLSGVARYTAHVPLRWTDQDPYGHVNHARTVTLLEEARIGLVFDLAAERGLALAGGLLVASLHVDYQRQIPYRTRPLPVQIWAHTVRAASFLLDYEVPDDDGTSAVTARTQMVPFDMGAQRPRRLTPEERAFLAEFADG